MPINIYAPKRSFSINASARELAPETDVHSSDDVYIARNDDIYVARNNDIYIARVSVPGRPFLIKARARKFKIIVPARKNG